MTLTKAGEALRAALRSDSPSRVMTGAELARRLGVKQPSVSEWVRMNTRPEAHLRKAIERELGIPESDWMTDDERALADGRHLESGPALGASPRNGTDG